jgi:cytochrome c-type biogenesis protein CcmH/NrfG
VLIAMGVTHINKNEPDKAKEYLLKAETVDPSQADIQYYLGSIALQQNNQAEAITRLEKFLSMNPTNATYKDAAEKLIAALKQAQAAPKQ